ncbi:MAG: DUF2868 domain-containing protein [Steroidobacteraceae bacterium]|jgi:hypothetical protein|nr:DUF2868 domain-containing protein [Steroidobacteraceae bacterium]
MSRHRDRGPLFADAIEIPRWLERDRETRYADRLQRDRQIGRELRCANPAARVREWWSRLPRAEDPPSMELSSAVRRIERGRRLITLLMIVIGAVAGAAVASAVFHYEGVWPVNVVTVLATLVLLQLLLVTLTLLLMLPKIPGLAGLQELLGGLNPGALAAAVYRRLGRANDQSATLFEWRAARGPAAARFARWQILTWSQTAAVAFNLGALGAAVGLIAFTDLAFGWSTTLRIEAAEALRITNAISAPWRSWWPEAVPGAQLIEQSRYFRLASERPSLSPAETLTGWWPFLLAAILTYGLAPRCLLLAISLGRLRAATRRLLMDDPGVRALLDRMCGAAVALGATEPEAPPPANAASTTGPAPHTVQSAAAVVWSGALSEEAARAWAAAHLQRNVTQVHEAGGGRSIALDRAVIEQLARQRAQVVLVFVRAWEAPLLDLKDFLAELRAGVGAEASLILAPVGAGGGLATDQQRAVWSRWTGGIADPALYLESGA